MKIIEIAGYLPSTAANAEHSSSVRMQQLLEGMATEHNSSVTMFRVSDGTAYFGIADNDAMHAVAESFKNEPDVKVSETTMLSLDRELNRRMQQKAEKAAATREQNKKKGSS